MTSLAIPLEAIVSPALAEENSNEFINKQLVSKTFDCLDGADFERNLLPAQNKDRYTTVKLAGKVPQDGEYAEKVRSYLDKDTIDTLLYCCRFCSYLGGPGFPELVLFGHEVSFRYTGFELSREQQLFVIVATALGIESLGMIRAVPERHATPTTYRIPVREVLADLTQSKRFAHYAGELEGLLEKERSRLKGIANQKDAAQCRDEIAYLEKQQQVMPFFLIKKWARDGVQKSELENHRALLKQTSRQEQERAQSLIARLQDDQAFASLGRGRDEETLKKRHGYIMDTLQIGPSRAEEILKRV